jgi:MoaD family protein
MVRVLYYATVRERIGTFETHVEGFSGTFAELLKHLEEQHGISVVDHSKGKGIDPLSVLIFMINGRHISHVGGFSAPVSEGDVVSVFPLLGGG